jgi:hypothetical protein
MPTLFSMAVVPFRDSAVAHWYDEVEQARQDFLTGLDDLRAKADSYLTVSALATTLFAVLAPDRTNGSAPHPVVDAPPETPTGGDPRLPPRDTKATARIALAPTGNTSASYPDEPPAWPPLPAPAGGDVASAETAMTRAITSLNRIEATVGVPLSFTVTTTGTPVPTITSKGALPGYLTFMNNGDGTATLCGRPRTTGVYHFTVRCTFGKHTDKYVVMQSFTLTVRR